MSDPFLAADLRRMVDLWFAQTGGESYRGFVSADDMWAALDPVAAPHYGKPIAEVPLREIYNASPATLNVGNAPGLVIDGLADVLVSAAGPAAVLGGIVVLGLVGVRMIVGGLPGLPGLPGGGNQLVIPLTKRGGIRRGFKLA